MIQEGLSALLFFFLVGERANLWRDEIETYASGHVKSASHCNLVGLI